MSCALSASLRKQQASRQETTIVSPASGAIIESGASANIAGSRIAPLKIMHANPRNHRHFL
jgi:hypothetical protein